MKCQCSAPGVCVRTGKRIRWAEIQTCRPSANPSESPKSCRDCVHKGEPVNAANGHQVGSRGCNCTPESVASGVLWWTCSQSGKPVAETRAGHCPEFTPKGN